MKQYGILKAIVLAFFSRNLYRDVARNWSIARTIGYLLVLLGICWTVMLFKIQPILNRSVTSFVHLVDEQLPAVITVKKGILTTPENRPYFIKGTDQKTNLAVFDTSGQFKTPDEAHARLLITQDSIYYVDNSDVVNVHKIPSDVSLELYSVAIGKVLIRAVRWAWLLLFPVFLFVSFIYRLLESLLFAVIGKIFAGLMRVSLHYLDLVKLSMVAFTPDIVLGTVFRWAGLWVNLGWIFYFTISMVYLIFAISAMKQKRQEG